MKYRHFVILLMLLTGCASKNDGTIRWVDGSVMKADQHQITKNQQLLLSAKNAGDLERKIEGGIVFDGIAETVEINKSTGLRKVTLSINNISHGSLNNKK